MAKAPRFLKNCQSSATQDLGAFMRYFRMPIEVESPEEYGYGNIRYNLSESSIRDRSLSDLGLTVPNLTLLYGEHRGSPRLRELIVADQPDLSAADVLITGGAATALFIVSTALLGASDHLVVVRPNYATNLETPRAIGCAINFIDLQFEASFRLDFDALSKAITPQTRLVSVTCPHNPSGVMFTADELSRLVALTAAKGCYLLVDETYRDLSFEGPLPLAAALGRHVISVSSLSKACGIPGIRIGWLISRDPKLQETFLAAKEQISICGSVIDEWVAEQVLAGRGAILEPTLVEMRKRRQLVSEWIAREPLLECVPPHGGVVCFPRMTSDPPGGTAGFYRRLLETHGTYVGPGHWFERPDSFFRLGYGWPTREELEAGLAGISRALRG
jgi:aspartate/methionine/tyrosine aminotransferase